MVGPNPESTPSPRPDASPGASPSPAGGEDARAVGEWRARSRRRLAWIVLAATVILLPIVYVASHAFLAGDYLLHERYLSAIFLRMEWLPRWDYGPHSTWSSKGYYVAAPDGIQLWSRIDHSFGGLIPHAAAKWEMSKLVAVAGRPHHYDIVSSQGFLRDKTAERFPEGSLREFHDAIAKGAAIVPADVLRAARTLHTRLPERLTTKYWLVAALYMAGETAEADRLLAQWRADFEASADPRASHLLRLLEGDRVAATPAEVARRAAYAASFAASGGAASGGILPIAKGLDDLMGWMADLDPEDIPRLLSLDPNVPQYLSLQVTTKVARIWATLLMADGRRDEANRLLRGTAAFATGTVGPHDVIHVLIFQAALRALLVAGLIDCHVQGEWTAEELETIWREWEDVWGRVPRFDSLEVARALDPETTGFDALKADALGGGHPGGGPFDLTQIPEATIRVLFTEARRELLREGLRVRHALLTRGDWPPIDAEGALGGLLLTADTPPVDPFETPPRPLRARLTSDTLTLWSVGPDVRDDGGAIVYDPTNGSVSAGDLVIALDRATRYRFPRAPGHEYADVAEFHARYPHGMPLDSFSNNASKPLQLTTDGTGILWSYGPDADEGATGRRLPPLPQVEALYDPTNGLTSQGDLYRKLNFRTPPASAAPPPPVAGPMPSPFLPPPPAP